MSGECAGARVSFAQVQCGGGACGGGVSAAGCGQTSTLRVSLLWAYFPNLVIKDKKTCYSSIDWRLAPPT